MTTAPERHLIKKYANRKLYDTRTSRYVTLDGIAQLVRDGESHELVIRGVKLNLVDALPEAVEHLRAMRRAVTNR